MRRACYNRPVALTVYHYPGCSTCRKALSWLRARGVTFEPVHIVDHPPSAATLARSASLAGVPVKKLFNVAGESYRAGNYKQRLAAMSEAEAFAALAADGKLIKRPLAISDAAALVGFDEATWAAALPAR